MPFVRLATPAKFATERTTRRPCDYSKGVTAGLGSVHIWGCGKWREGRQLTAPKWPSPEGLGSVTNFGRWLRSHLPGGDDGRLGWQSGPRHAPTLGTRRPPRRAYTEWPDRAHPARPRPPRRSQSPHKGRHWTGRAEEHVTQRMARRRRRRHRCRHRCRRCRHRCRRCCRRRCCSRLRQRQRRLPSCSPPEKTPYRR